MPSGRIRGITIEIGGDTTKLTKALGKVDSAISKTQTNLRDLNKALKLDPTNTNLLKSRQKELAKEIGLTKERLDKEKEAYKQLAAADKTPENVEKMKDLQMQIDLDTAALKDLENQAKQAASVMGSKMQAAGDKIAAVGGKITALGDSLTNLGSKMTATITTPIITGFAAAVKTAGDFDAAMDKVQAVSGASAEEMVLLRDKAKEMGETTKFSASESAEALNYMAMAGWKSEDMLSGIEGIMSLAAASGEELGTTSDIVTDALTAFGMEANEAGRFSDILASAASNANTNVAMMGESFKYVAPVAGSLGYTAEDVAVALGLMANAGIKSDMAGTSLRNMFTRMAKPTKESGEAMDRLGISLEDDEHKMYSFRQIMDQLRGSFTNINMSIEDYDASVAQLDEQLAEGTLTQNKYDKALEELNLQAFGAEGAEKARAAAMLGGSRAMAGLLAITNASEQDYEKLTSAIDGSSQAFAKLEDGSIVPLNDAWANGKRVLEQYDGAAEAMAATMQDNLPGQLTILKSQIEALAISIGEILMPYIRQAVSVIQGWVAKFKDLDDSEKIQIIKLAGLAAAIGPVLVVVGTLVSVIGKLVTGFGALVSGAGKLMTFFAGANPIIVGIVAAVALLAAGIAHLYTTNEQFRESIKGAFDNMKAAFASAVEAAQPAIEGLVEAFNSLIEFLAPVFEVIAVSVMALVTGIMNMIAPLVDFISGIITTIQGILQAWYGVWEGDTEALKTGIENIFTGLGVALKAIFEAIVGFIVGILETFGVDVKGAFNKVKETVIPIMRSAMNTVRNIWNNGLGNLVTKAKTILTSIKTVFDDLKTAIKEKITGIKDSMKTWGKDMIDGFISGIKEKVTGVTDAVSGIADTIKSYLHFTVPDKGPLADADTWAPDMMKLFADGIVNNKSLVTRALTSAFDYRSMVGNIGSRIASNDSQAIAAAPINVNVTLQGDAGRLFRVVSVEAARNQVLTGSLFSTAG